MNSRSSISGTFIDEKVQLGFDWWDGFAALMMMLFQVSWLIPMYQLVISWESLSSELKIAATLSPIFITAYVLSRGLRQWGVVDGFVRVAETLVLIGGTYTAIELLLIVPPNPDQARIDPRTGIIVEGSRVASDMLVIFLAVVVMWRVGVYLGRNGVRQKEALRNFRLGIVMWLAFIFGSSLVNFEAPLYLMFFSLFAGLVGLAFSRIGSVNRLKGGGKIRYSRSWVTEIFIGVGALVLVSATVGAILGGPPGKAILGGIFRWLITGLSILVAPLLILVEYLMSKLRQSFGRPVRGGGGYPDDEGLPAFELPEDIVPKSLEDIVGGELETILPYVIGLIVLLLILRGIWTRRQAKAGVLVTFDDEWERGSLFGGLRESMVGLRDTMMDNLQSLRDQYLRAMLTKARIRRMYSKFLVLCEDLEISRKESETPLEFVISASAQLPDRKQDIADLTKAYEKVRYGEIPETDEDVEKIQDAWKRIEEDGGQLIKHNLKLKKQIDKATRFT